MCHSQKTTSTNAAGSQATMLCGGRRFFPRQHCQGEEGTGRVRGGEKEGEGGEPFPGTIAHRPIPLPLILDFLAFKWASRIRATMVLW